MDKSVNKRIEWIDIMKGIGIILVVIGHSSMVYSIPYLFKTIYLFHMPLFFFISGYVYKKSEIKEFAKKKAEQLLIPYCSLVLLFLPIATFIFPTESNLFNSGSKIVDIARYLLGRNLMNALTGTLWFLTCLFFTQVVYNFIQNKFKPKIVHVVVFIFLIISFVIHYYNNVYNPYKFWLPFSFHLIFATIPIYHIGYLFKRYDIKVNILVLAVCLIITIIGIITLRENVYNIYGSFFGVPFVTLFCSIVLTLFVKEVSVFISKNKSLTGIFAYLGRTSLIIMAFHLLFILVIKQFTSISLIAMIGSILLSLLVYQIFIRYSITRALFLGDRQDIQILKNRFIK